MISREAGILSVIKIMLDFGLPTRFNDVINSLGVIRNFLGKNAYGVI